MYAEIFPDSEATMLLQPRFASTTQCTRRHKRFASSPKRRNHLWAQDLDSKPFCCTGQFTQGSELYITLGKRGFDCGSKLLLYVMPGQIMITPWRDE